MANRIVVIGCSWGGLAALKVIFPHLPSDFPAAVVLVQHRVPDSRDRVLVDALTRACPLPVRSVQDKDPILAGTVFIAPPDYHLLVESGSFALSVDERVQFSRPSIDVLFESVAETYGEGVIGVILTGAGADGAAGLSQVRRQGGYGLVQDPATAEQPSMPRAAIASGGADEVLPLTDMAPALMRLCGVPLPRGS